MSLVNLHPLAPYLALSILPIGNALMVNLVRFSWAFRRGLAGAEFKPVPAEAAGRVELIDRYMANLKSLFFILSVLALARWDGLSKLQLGLSARHWELNLLLGSGSGLLKVALAVATSVSNSTPGEETASNYMRGGSILFWLPTLLVSAFAEESWIAACLITLLAAMLPIVIAVGLTAMAFGAAHLGYRFSTATGIAASGVFSCLIFLWTRSLVATCLFHFVGNLGPLYLIRRRIATNGGPIGDDDP